MNIIDKIKYTIFGIIISLTFFKKFTLDGILNNIIIELLWLFITNPYQKRSNIPKFVRYVISIIFYIHLFRLINNLKKIIGITIDDKKTTLLTLAILIFNYYCINYNLININYLAIINASLQIYTYKKYNKLLISKNYLPDLLITSFLIFIYFTNGKFYKMNLSNYHQIILRQDILYHIAEVFITYKSILHNFI